MKVDISKRAKKQLKGSGKATQIILAKRIREIGKSKSKEEKLKGFKNIFRTRVGNYRIVYKKNLNQIVIVLIGHRQDIYQLVKQLLD